MAKVEELRKSLGATAKDPMVALQLAELERVENIRAGIYDRIQAGQADPDTTGEYARYNQRHNDTMKTLMAMLKLKAKTAEGKAVESPYTDEQVDLVGIDDSSPQTKNKRGH